jgi:hypothetical protein
MRRTCVPEFATAGNRLQVLISMVHVTGASVISEERTLQYFVTDSSTARAAFSG